MIDSKLMQELPTEDLLNELKKRGYIQVFWTKDDVEHAIIEFGQTVTPEAVNVIVGDIEGNFDASVGINWDQIGVYVHEYFNPREK